MPQAANSGDLLLSGKYEIAEPIAYPMFTVPDAPETRLSRESLAPSQPGPYHEAWDDSGKERHYEATLNSAATSEDEAHRHEEMKAAARETRAIWIVHGMGQQIPFETLDSLAQGLLQVARPKGVPVPPRLRTVRFGEQVLQRVELDIDGVEKDANGTPKRQYELHLYECYWAPKTEGVAKLADTVAFLWDGGLRGLLNCLKCFQRAMFGRMQGFRVPVRTPIWIGITLLVLLALTAINAVILAAAAARANLVHFASLDGQWERLAALASAMTAEAFAFGAVLFLAEMSKPGNLQRGLRLTISILSWIALIVTIFSVIGTAFVMLITTRFAWGVALLNSLPRAQLQAFATLVILASAGLAGAAMAWRAVLRSSGESLRGNWFMSVLFALSFALNLASIAGAVWIWKSRAQVLWFQMPGVFAFLYSSVWVWPFLIVLSAKIREVMVQYVGDVAIYVTPNKVDRFDDVRNKIKDTARTVASAVYLACKPGTNDFLYQQIALVGHSLGSVIAYDTLNRLMVDDWLAKNHLGIANRTNCMVTFGSPLNKTAFFFTIQGSDTLHIRERLAAAVQPLIQSYAKFRKFKWINVFSRNDIISGALEFYDLPSIVRQTPLPDVAVHNVVDKDAAVPLVAHVNYWHNETVWKQLLSEIAP
jgi:hypothetical protein